MSSVITSLSTGITLSGLWSIILPIVPFIVIIFALAFGIHLFHTTYIDFLTWQGIRTWEKETGNKWTGEEY